MLYDTRTTRRMQISAIDMQMSRLAHRPMNVEQRETLDRRNRNAFNCRFRLRFLLSSSSSSSSLFRFVLESTLHSLSLSLSLGRNWALRDLCSHANALDSYANDGRPSEQLTNEKKNPQRPSTLSISLYLVVPRFLAVFFPPISGRGEGRP